MALLASVRPTSVLTLSPQFPVVVTRSIKVIERKKNYSVTSCSFTATFADNSQKTFCFQSKTENWLIGKNYECTFEYCDKDVCSLYYQDWSVVPCGAPKPIKK